MRARLLPGLAIATAFAFGGCMADDFQANSGTGRVSVDVSINQDVKDAAISRTTASTIKAEDLMVRLSSEDGSFSKEWKLNDFPSNGEYTIGNYLMEAYYGAEDNEGFDSPYYYGSSTFQIKHNQTSTVAFEVALGNSMVTLQFEDSFKNYLENFTAQLATSSGKTLDYASTNEGAPIYVKSGAVSLSINCTLPSGNSGTFHVADFTVEPKNHYKMTLGINYGDPSNPGAGAASLTISFDEALQQEPLTIELSDELFNATAPVITPSFDTTQPIILAQGDTPTQPLAMTLLAQGEFASVQLSTESASLSKLGWPSQIDLLSATQAQRDKLKNLGLVVLGLYQNPEQMAQIDFSEVASHISYVSGASNDNTFTVKVTDKNGKESAPVSFTISIGEISCEILSHFMMVGSDNLQLNIRYTGKNAQDNVRLYYMSELGSYTAFKVNSCTDNGDGTFSFDLTTPTSPKDPTYIMVKVSFMGKEFTKKLECGMPDFSVAAYDAYATYALVDFVCDVTSETLLNQAQFSVSADGGAFNNVATQKVAGTNHLKISGLTPGTSYQVKCTLLGKESSNTASFTTEAATQLPNNGMEEWYSEQPYSKYQMVYYPGATKDTPWATMNSLTTSTGGTSTLGKTSYRAYSGTQPVTEQGMSAKVGSNAAYIATVGWGSGNTAAGTTAGKCENITAGTLSLDNYTFASRPMSMTFYYQYKNKSSNDYGLAQIKVLDSNGTEICSNSKELTSASDWTSVTLDLSYPIDVKKASSIVILFKSSDNSACLEYKSENISVPSFGNTTDGRYTGSVLLVDEIILNY